MKNSLHILTEFEHVIYSVFVFKTPMILLGLLSFSHFIGVFAHVFPYSFKRTARNALGQTSNFWWDELNSNLGRPELS